MGFNEEKNKQTLTSHPIFGAKLVENATEQNNYSNIPREHSKKLSNTYNNAKMRMPNNEKRKTNGVVPRRNMSGIAEDNNSNIDKKRRKKSKRDILIQAGKKNCTKHISNDEDSVGETRALDLSNHARHVRETREKSNTDLTAGKSTQTILSVTQSKTSKKNLKNVHDNLSNKSASSIKCMSNESPGLHELLTLSQAAIAIAQAQGKKDQQIQKSTKLKQTNIEETPNTLNIINESGDTLTISAIKTERSKNNNYQTSSEFRKAKRKNMETETSKKLPNQEPLRNGRCNSSEKEEGRTGDPLFKITNKKLSECLRQQFHEKMKSNNDPNTKITKNKAESCISNACQTISSNDIVALNGSTSPKLTTKTAEDTKKTEKSNKTVDLYKKSLSLVSHTLQTSKLATEKIKVSETSKLKHIDATNLAINSNRSAIPLTIPDSSTSPLNRPSANYNGNSIRLPNSTKNVKFTMEKQQPPNLISVLSKYANRNSVKNNGQACSKSPPPVTITPLPTIPSYTHASKLESHRNFQPSNINIKIEEYLLKRGQNDNISHIRN